MRSRNITLRRQFLIRILSVLLMIIVVSSAVEWKIMKNQVDNQTFQQAEGLAKNVLMGMEETELAKKNIEHQIDLKLVSYSKQIATLLNGKSSDQITRGELLKIKDELGLAGISVFKESNSKDDIIAVVSTDKEEIGFSFKKSSDYYEVGKMLLSGQKPIISGATFTEKNTLVLPIAQSGSHAGKPVFFKYAYYHAPGTDYIINPYIEANEVNHYTEKVGPNARINQLIKENRAVKEIAILNPRVFANPSLEKHLYPPLKKIEAGRFDLQTKKDKKLLTQHKVKKTTFIENVNGKKLYKMFIPLDKNRVIYLALDYDEMRRPLIRNSIILIISGLISLIALFLLTARFFNRIYNNIQKIIQQIRLLEKGDLTAKSHVNDHSELENLSQSANRMVDKLNKLVKDTQEQATKTQKLSVLLEAETSQTIEKIYAITTETTMKSREQLYEIISFLDELVETLQPYKKNEQVLHIIEKVEDMKQIANERTAATTDMTITLSDLIHSLHGQSRELSEISNALLESMKKFKL